MHDRAYADIQMQMRLDAIRHIQANRSLDPARSDSQNSRQLSFGEVESQSSITPNFAPAWNGPARLRRQESIRWDSDPDSLRSAVVRRYRVRPGRPLERASQSRSESQDTTDAVRNLPPLRRMGQHRIERRSPSPIVNGMTDGLGDRERSLSSEVDSVWDTMLTTITPDPHMPSADSSFTSAVASASFSAPDQAHGRRTGREASSSSTSSIPSARSSATHLTVPSREDLNRLDCDTSEASGSETEADVGPPRLRMRREQRRPNYRPQNSSRRSASPQQDDRAARPESQRRSSRRSEALTLSRDQWGSRMERRRQRDQRSPALSHWQAISNRAVDMLSDATRRHTPEVESGMNGVERTIDTAVERQEREAIERFVARINAASPDEDDDDGYDRLFVTVNREPLHSESNAERDDSAEGLMEGLIAGASENGSAEDRELELFRPILERLASRQDIPEAFWMSAGLTRVMAQRADDERR
jgi:hypothetical protein